MSIKILNDVSLSGNLSANNINVDDGNHIVQSPKTVTSGISGISQILVMNQTTYNTLSPKLSTTLYVIV